MSEKNNPQKAVLKQRSENFVARLRKSWSEDFGAIDVFSPHQKMLAERICLKVEQSLTFAEERRKAKGGKGLPMTWGNINLEKLLVDSADRIKLGLDAMIPNHIWVIPYYNTIKEQYDLDLRIGYKGKDYYRRKVAVVPPKNIRYELVYNTDEFTIFKKDMEQITEGYTFNITDPFNRGDVVGGFGYIEYEDESLNELVIVSLREFNQARNYAKSDTFWKNHPEKMMFKTLVSRVTDHLQIDPEKINSAVVAKVEAGEIEIKNIQKSVNKKTIEFKEDVKKIEDGEKIEDAVEVKKVKAEKPGGNGSAKEKPAF